MTLLYGFTDLFYIIGDLRDQYDIGAARHTGIKSQISHLVSHYLHDKDPAMGCCSGMYAVYGSSGHIHRALETKGHVGSPQIIVNGLGQGHHIKALCTQEVRGFMGAVSSQDHQAVELKLIIILLHGLHFIHAVLIRILDRLKRSSRTSKYRSALGKDSGKITRCQHAEIAVDKSLIPLQETVDLNIRITGDQSLHHASHGCVQSLTVTAACQHSDSQHNLPPSPYS